MRTEISKKTRPKNSQRTANSCFPEERMKQSYPTDRPLPERSIAARSICWEPSRNNRTWVCWKREKNDLVVFWAESAVTLISMLFRLIAESVERLTGQPCQLSRSPNHGSPPSPSRTRHGSQDGCCNREIAGSRIHRPHGRRAR
jgi:hypothetical protein